MRIEWKAYGTCILSGDELCVAAAFLNLPCLYGVSGEWIRKSGENLKNRIAGIMDSLERRKILLVEPGGTVRMEEQLYRMIETMGHAGRIGRICFGTGSSLRRIYLYRKGERLVCMEPDGRGRCLLGQFPSARALRETLSEENKSVESAAGAEAGIGEASGGTGSKRGEWLGALVFEERTDRFFEVICDMAWEQEMGKDELYSSWRCLCGMLEEGGDGRTPEKASENLEAAAGR